MSIQPGVCAVVPPTPDTEFANGSREYQFFRAAIKWLESKRKLPAGTLSSYLREADRAAKGDNGMINWKNVFGEELDGRTPQDLHRSALKEVVNRMEEYAYGEEDERRVYQRMSQMARRIAERRAEDTGHGAITEDWEQVANRMERTAHEGAEAFGDAVTPPEAPAAADVEADVGFGEGAEAAAAGAEVAEGAVGAEEILGILGAILLL